MTSIQLSNSQEAKSPALAQSDCRDEARLEAEEALSRLT